MKPQIIIKSPEGRRIEIEISTSEYETLMNRLAKDPDRFVLEFINPDVRRL